MSAAVAPRSGARREAGSFRFEPVPLRLAAVLLLLTIPPACGTRSPSGDAGLRVRAVALDPGELAAASDLHERFRLVGAWRLEAEDPRFGGFSALLVDDDRFVLLSDRGRLWSAERDTSGPLPVRLEPWRVQALRVGGRPPDAEALAKVAPERALIATESPHALAALPLDDPAATLDLEARPLPEPLASLPTNRGVEALAPLEDRSVLAIAEHATGGTHTAMVIGAGAPRLSAYRAAPGFAPTGADRLGEWLYVLERRFGPFTGFEARVVAVALPDAERLPPILEPAYELARLRGPGPVDNFEGIAVEAVPGSDRIRVWLVSDDNFSRLQRTLLVALEWAPQAPVRASNRRFSRTNSAGNSRSDTERR